MTPPARDASLAQRLAAACTAALGDGRCDTSGEPENPVAPVTAEVVWTDPSHVRIEVTDTRNGQRVERDLVFRSSDREDDRWQAAGLVVAALAHAVQEAKVAPGEEIARPSRPASRSWISAGTLVGNGLDPGPPRIGAWARVVYRVPVVPLFAGAGASYALASGGSDALSSQWTTLSALVGATLDVSSVDLELQPRLEGLVQCQSARAEGARPAAPAPGDRLEGSRWLLGLAAGLEAVWPARGRLALVTGLSGSLMSGGTTIRLNGEKHASFPGDAFAVTLGLRLSLSP